MILGTYWYFEFPTDLYKFDFFEYRQGYGGHADKPAELITDIEAEDPEKIISDLKLLITTYNEGSLFIYRDGQKLKIGTGGHQLFDYDFLLISKVENILRREKIKLVKDQKLNNPTFFRLNIDSPSNKYIYPKKSFLQLVGSELKKHNAENSKLRLDCNLKLKDKENFIDELKEISKEENIKVLFYFDKDFESDTNLMIFFTNGRQGLNLAQKQFVNTKSFENKIEESITKNNVKFGHISGFGLYPQNGPKIELMIDEEFII